MFRAIKQHATGTYHGNQRHCMLVIKKINKTPLLNLFQRSTEEKVAPLQTWQMIWQIQTENNSTWQEKR